MLLTESEWQARHDKSEDAKVKVFMQKMGKANPDMLHAIGYCGGIQASADYLREMASEVRKRKDLDDGTKQGAISALNFSADVLQKFAEGSADAIRDTKKGGDDGTHLDA